MGGMSRTSDTANKTAPRAMASWGEIPAVMNDPRLAPGTKLTRAQARHNRAAGILSGRGGGYDGSTYGGSMLSYAGEK